MQHDLSETLALSHALSRACAVIEMPRWLRVGTNSRERGAPQALLMSADGADTARNPISMESSRNGTGDRGAIPSTDQNHPCPYIYRPPRSSSRTRHLYLANTGPAVQVPLERVRAALEFFGELEVVSCPDSCRPFVYATFVDQGAADKARMALEGAYLGDRRLAVRYAEIDVSARPALVPCPIFTSAEATKVPGLVLLPDFISVEEEKALLEGIRGCGDTWARLAKRRVQHYGYEFSYAMRSVDRRPLARGLPAWVEPVRRRVERLRALGVEPLDQMTVNEYARGVGLAPHVDTHSAFQGAIVSLSLAGHTVMEFRRDGARRALVLPPRSLLVMSGESRYAWQHYIPHRKYDDIPGAPEPTIRPPTRVSITLRRVKYDACTCQFPEHCDSRQPGMLQSLQREPTLVIPPSSSPAAPAREASIKVPETSQLKAASQNSSLEQEGIPDPPTVPISTQISSDIQAVEDKTFVTVPKDDFHICEPSDHVKQNGVSTSMMLDASERLSEESKLATTDQVGEGRKAGAAEADATAAQSVMTEGTKMRTDALVTPEIEREHVQAMYDAIAPHFSVTRFSRWPRVIEFLKSQEPHSIVADCGCGNGKYLAAVEGLQLLGSDMSVRLLELCCERGYDVTLADTIHLPYRTGSCDAAISIAVLHHMSSWIRRKAAIEEMLRIVKEGGLLLISVWAKEQENPKKTLLKWTPIDADKIEQTLAQPGTQAVTSLKNSAEGSSIEDTHLSGGDYFVPWHLPKHRLPSATGDEGEASSLSPALREPMHAVKDEEKGTVMYNRYYHLFVDGELQQLVSQVPNAELVDSYFDHSNWCVILRKRTSQSDSI
eukprot:CAMPEP_0114230918 /NCGR_PEP_ID=MMETSP0058-20121206/3740_1 /TAXON_ID=36894 /ORGANISM="Pyramimonas parkeae, CCMP726" /LENGTH=833 /DNA_ID=CAMNT_0001342179 /DNA_START=52 /DNA_END=2553 /DNA_ORIENTATION=-